MRTADFSFELPGELIAQEPAEPRGSSRLLSVDRAAHARGAPALDDLAFTDLPGLLRPGDLLVVNDSRVIPARLFGRKESGGKVELLLLAHEGEGRWEALVKGSKRSRPGTVIELGAADGVESATLTVIEERGGGMYLLEFAGGEATHDEVIERLGVMPLPPYIRRGVSDERDREWYQTVYAHPGRRGSAAAPTAGLHFTPALLEELARLGVERAPVTLHVGLGTFQPVRAEQLSSHEMHAERFEVPEETAAQVNRAKAEGRRVVAVGTTATRVLEHAGRTGQLVPGAGETRLFISPGFEFRMVDAMLTNFHLPESTLLMLVSAFAGREFMLEAYRHAVAARYRFYSYGDAMFIHDGTDERR